MVVQKWLGWVLAPVMLVLCVVALTTVDWKLVASIPPADFGSLMAGIGVVAAGTGVSWMSTGADYSRYLPSTVSKRRLFASVLGGSSVPLVLLVSSGAFLALGNSAAAGLALPDWLLVPYLIASVLGLLAAADLAMYSLRTQPAGDRGAVVASDHLPGQCRSGAGRGGRGGGQPDTGRRPDLRRGRAGADGRVLPAAGGLGGRVRPGPHPATGPVSTAISPTPAATGNSGSTRASTGRP